MDRSGIVLDAGQGLPSGTFASISPDGRRIVYVTGAGTAGSEIWTYDLAQHTRTRVATGTMPSWLPDGERIVYSIREPAANSVYLKTADSSREVQKLADGYISSVSPDGKYLFFSRDRTLWYQPLDAKASPVSLGIKALTARVGAALSPDSRYLLYVESESGRNEVYLARFPAMDHKWQVSVNGGTAPKWNRRGDRFYFVRERTLCEVDFESGETPRIGAPRDLLNGDMLDALLSEFGYDITPDGKNFLFTRDTEEKGAKNGIIVVENWFREFRGREPK